MSGTKRCYKAGTNRQYFFSWKALTIRLALQQQ